MTTKARSVLDIVAVVGVSAVIVHLLARNGTSSSDLAIWLIVLVGAAISSIAGFAFAAITGALLFQATNDKVYALQVILVSSVALQSYCVWQLRRSIEPRSLAAYFGGGLLTIGPGVYLFLATPVAIYLVLLGAFLIAYSVYSLKRPQLRLKSDHVAGRLISGALGGITGATAGFPGAFVTIWCGAHGWEKERQRATYQPFILGMQLLTLSALAMFKPSQIVAIETAKFAVPALLGAFAGWRMFESMQTRQFNITVSCFLMFSGFTLLLKGLLS